MAAEYEIVENFETRHAQVDPDPAVELRRRCQMWASAPPSRDVSLDAAIVPMKTVHAAIAEIEASRATIVALAEALETAAARFDRFERRLPELASETQRAEMAIYAGQCADECRKVTSRLKGDST